MTAILPEQPAILANVLLALADADGAADVRTDVGARLVRALGLTPPPRHQAPDWATDPDFRSSVQSGLYETYEAYCARISKETP